MIQISQRLALQQKQSPQQVLLSTLLQLPVLRLEQRIKQELEINPLLELDLDEDIEQVEAQEQEEKELDEDQEGEEEEEFEDREEEEEIDWDTILNDEDNFEIRAPKEAPEEEMDRPEPAPVTLMDHLLEQLHLSKLTQNEMEIGEYILWCLDDAGYLSCDLEAVVEQFSVELSQAEEVLKVIQRFDPVGIGARNLQECLLIQLKEKFPEDKNAIRMISECFEDFTNKRFEKIAKKLEISLDEVRRIMDLISKLNPKPGERYISEAENYITPDVLVVKEDGNFRIVLNDWNMPGG